MTMIEMMNVIMMLTMVMAVMMILLQKDETGDRAVCQIKMCKWPTTTMGKSFATRPASDDEIFQGEHF